MATAIKPVQKPGVEEAEAAPIHRIRITLTSKNVKSLEKGGWAWLGGCCMRACECTQAWAAAAAVPMGPVPPPPPSPSRPNVAGADVPLLLCWCCSVR